MILNLFHWRQICQCRRLCFEWIKVCFSNKCRKCLIKLPHYVNFSNVFFFYPQIIFLFILPKKLPITQLIWRGGYSLIKIGISFLLREFKLLRSIKCDRKEKSVFLSLIKQFPPRIFIVYLLNNSYYRQVPFCSYFCVA